MLSSDMTLTMFPATSNAEGMDAPVASYSRDVRRQLDAFLRDVEGRAYRMTLLQVNDRDEALDIVQDAMIALVRRYARRPCEQWPPLFFRILRNRTRDWFRRQAVKRRVMGWLPSGDRVCEASLEAAPAPESHNPLAELSQRAAIEALQAALSELPARQREAFMLRSLEGLDVRETAIAMQCSQGSVKTHYSRAVHALRDKLGDHW